MGYLNEDGLARYDGLVKNWVTFKSGTVDGIDPLLNWQKTEDAGAVSCYPLPASPLEPNVSFMFTEMSPVNGNKSSSNPSTITGVSSITVTRCETAGVDSTDYTIALGDTYYGGTLDVAAGVLTVTHVMVEPDASTIDISTNPAKLPLSYADTFGRTVTSANGTALSVGSTGGMVIYQLATPEIVQLTPTQIYSLAQVDEYTPRLNTVYSDQQSVRVGYAKSPIHTEQELSNAIVSLGGNI